MFWFIDLKIVIVVVVVEAVVVVEFSVSKINRFMRWYNDALFNRTTFNQPMHNQRRWKSVGPGLPPTAARNGKSIIITVVCF